MIISSRDPNQLAQEGNTQNRVGLETERQKGVLIIQFNYGQANYNTLRPIFDVLEPEKRLLLIIQEPALNKHTGTTYCLRGFKLIYEVNPATRVCFIVSEELGTGQWRHQTYGPHVIKLKI